MAQTAALVDVLKRELRARGVTYAQVARNLLRGFFLETLDDPAPRLRERHAATVQVR